MGKEQRQPASPTLRIQLLGDFCLSYDDRPVTTVNTARLQSLLAYLLLHRDAPQARQHLAFLLWPDSTERQARTNLRKQLHYLRRALPDPDRFLQTDAKTLSWLRDTPFTLDVAEFEGALDQAERADDTATSQTLLEQAVDLYQGDLLPSCYDDWIFHARERLYQRYIQALQQLIRSFERQRVYVDAIGYAQRLLRQDPLHETTHRRLMRLYAWSGQRAAALSQYAECQRILKEELGVPPDATTTELYKAIQKKEQLPPPSEWTAGPVSAPTAPRHNLPVQLTSFVGREGLLTQISAGFQDPGCRLLTLVGPGGSGKTRLALEAAAAQVEASGYEHGVFFVSLAPLDTVEAIVPTVAKTLGFSFYESVPPQQQLLDYLRTKSMLLVMDNCEHLLAPPLSSPPEGGKEGGLVELFTEILRAAPGIKMLVTSRMKLNVRGQQLISIAGMGLPEPGSGMTQATSISPLGGEARQPSAVQLFVQRARWVRSDFGLTVDNWQDVAHICRLVDGLPLGIELAAAWVDVLPLADIATEIRQGLDFLATDAKDVPERQRSMRAVFDHSWRLLAEREREVFQALSVFRGGFTRSAAQRIAGASLHELKGLADKSLLHRTLERYEMHELLRQYAEEKLKGSPEVAKAVRDRHCAFYCTFLGEREADLKGARQQVALAEIEAEIDNARSAWDWAIASKNETRLDGAVDSLCLFYEWRARYREGETACREATDRLEMVGSANAQRVRVRLLVWQARFCQAMGRLEESKRQIEGALKLLDSPQLAKVDVQAERAFALFQLGDITRDRNREDARRLAEQSLELYQRSGNRWAEAKVYALLGFIAYELGDYERAKRLQEQGLSIRQALHDQRGIAQSLSNLSVVAMNSGQVEEAERFAQSGLARLRKIGDRSGVAHMLRSLGWTVIYAGRTAEGHTYLEEAITILDELGDHNRAINTRSVLAVAKSILGQYDGAIQLGYACLDYFDEFSYPWETAQAHMLLGWTKVATGALAESERHLKKSVTLFRNIGRGDALSLAQGFLGLNALEQGSIAQAQHHVYEALRTATTIRLILPKLICLLVSARILAEKGERERALELYALTMRFPALADTRWAEDVAGQHIAAVAASVPMDVVAAARERGRARDLEATLAELLAELKA